MATSKALGTALVSTSAAAFGAYSYFAITAHRAGIGPIPLLSYRFAIAAAIFGLVLARSHRPFPNRRALLVLAGLGVLYVGQALTYLECLLASDPITASLLLYLYPAFVTAGSVLFLREKLTLPKGIALACAMAGSIVILGPIKQIGRSQS